MACGLSQTTALATLPEPAHIVIVIEENHSFEQLIGSPEAPYFNELVADGASFTSFYALTHPSQPNYIQFFSGANQGVLDNTSPPPGAPFATPNLGANLVVAGRSFAGYGEDLPFVGSTIDTFGNYRRRHCPWVNWQATVPGPNQLPIFANRPFFTNGLIPQPFYGDTNAPTDYSDLPTVSIVVPNLLNDMHDGTVSMADEWLSTWIRPYAEWAMSNNSLLIITWDEDESESRNRIPTILYGPMIVSGTNDITWTLHNLLRTIEDMYGMVHAGTAAKVRPIVGCFVGDAPMEKRIFRQGQNGYSDAADTYIEQNAPSAAHGANTPVVIDGTPLSQGLIRFNNVVGSGPNQIPQGVTILSAKLMILTGGPAGDEFSSNTISIHRMLTNWTDASTWNSLVGGVSRDDIEAASVADFSLIPNALNSWAIFDVTDRLQSVVNNPSLNLNWLIQPGGSDGWRFASSEAAAVGDRPTLEVTYDSSSCRATFTTQPTAAHVTVGQSVTLSASATGSAPLAYQWRRNTVALIDDGNITGVTSPTLNISSVALSDAGTYDVVVTNPCGPATSASVAVIVCNEPPNGDANADGLVDGNDIASFVAAVLIESTTDALVCSCDFAGNARVDVVDEAGFVMALLGQ